MSTATLALLPSLIYYPVCRMRIDGRGDPLRRLEEGSSPASPLEKKLIVVTAGGRMLMTSDRPLSRRYCHLLIRHRLFCTLATIALMLPAMWWIRQVHLSSRVTDYYPRCHPHVRLYQEFTEMLRMTNAVVVTITVKDGTIYTSEVLGKIHRITVALLETRGTNPFEVMSLTHPRLKDIKIRDGIINIQPVVDHPAEPHSPQELLQIKNAVYTNLGIRGVYVSPDDKTALIRAGFWDGMAEPRAILTQLQTLAEQERDANTEIAFTGNLVLAAWLIDTAPRFLLLLFVSAGVALLLAGPTLGFLNGPVIIVLVNAVAALWGFGMAGALSVTPEPLALLMLFPLCARGICLVLSWYAQLLSEYRAVFVPFEEQVSRERALERAATTLWRPLTSALCIDGATLLVLAFSDVPALRALGVLSIGWLLGLVLVLWTLLPLWSIIIPLRAPRTETGSWAKRLVTRVAHKCRGSRAPGLTTYLGLIAVSVLGLLAAVQLEAGREMMGTTLFYPTHPYNRAFVLVNDKFIGINQLIVIAQTPEPSAFRNPQALLALEAFQYHMAGDEQFGGAVAITNIIKSVTRMFHEGIPKWEMLPDDIDSTGQVIFRIINAAATPSEVERFLSTDFRTTAVTLFYRDYSPAIVNHALARAQDFVTQNGAAVEFRLGGGILGILAAIHAAVEKNYWYSLGALLLLTAVGARLSLGTLRAALGVTLTLTLSQAAMLILLWGGNIDLNIFTLPVVVISLGTTLIPAFLTWTRRDEAEAAAHVQALTTASVILAAAASTWLFSPLRLQAEMGVFLIVLACVNTVMPLRVLSVVNRP